MGYIFVSERIGGFIATVMDVTLKLDIDELVDEFTQIEATTLAEMKVIWRGRKFSFIHEARPTDKDSAFFMQTLYDRAISHMVGGDSFSRRLAGLYALYCLYETQLFDRPFKIYLSLSMVKFKFFKYGNKTSFYNLINVVWLILLQFK